MILSHDADAKKAAAREIDRTFSEAKSICEVASNRDLYVGRKIVIRGTYGETPHGRVLYDPDCGQIEMNMSRQLKPNDDGIARKTFRRAFARNRYAWVPTVFSGTLTFSPVIVGCDLPGCFSYTLENGELLAARLPEKAR